MFVYGTLKRGGEYEWVMLKAGGRYLGRAQLTTPYPLILDRYPCLLDEPGKGFKVTGEVYQVEQSSGWQHLDWLEGHPQEYLRRKEPVLLENGCATLAWTYFYLFRDRLGAALIPVKEFPIAGGSDQPV